MSEPNLSDRTAIAAIWLVAGRMIARLIDLASLVVIARILGPSDFGLIAVAMTVIYIVEAILEMPVSQALVNVDELTRPMLDTAYTISLLRGMFVAVICLAIAFPYALYAGDPRLFWIVIALSLAPSVRGLVSPALVTFVRKIDFRREFAIDVIGKLATAAVAITVALATRSYWAIVAGTVAGPVAMLAASFLLAPYRPRLTLSEWKVFSNLIGWNSVSQLFMAVNWQVDRLLLGRFAARSDMGRYTIANDLAAVPYQALVVPLVRPLLAGFSPVISEPERLRAAYLKSMSTVFSIVAPVLVLMALFSDIIVRILLGPKWQETGLIIACLALSGLPALMTTPFAALAVALRRPKFIAAQNLSELLVKLPVMTFAVVNFGVLGAIYSRVTIGVAVALFGMSFVKRISGISIRANFQACLRPVGSLLLMSAAMYPIIREVEKIQDTILFYAATALAGLLAGGIYASAMLASWALSGRPPGSEEMLMRGATKLLARVRRRPIAE